MKLRYFIKPLMSILMLTVVFYFVPIHRVVDTLLSIPWYVVVLVTVGYSLGQVLSAYKWWLISQSSRSIGASFPRALKSYFIGMFANCFGLGTIGGDLVRAVLLAGKKGAKTAALASVVADRAHGLAVLALLGTLCAALLGQQTFDSSWVYLLVTIGAVIVAAWAFGPRALLHLVHEGHALRTKAEQITEVFPKKAKMVAAITVLSVIFHLLQISLHWIMGVGFGVEVSWPVLLVAIPFVNILSSLPISWNGLGVREAGYVFFLSPVMLTQEQAVSFGAIWFVAVAISSAIGGMVAVLTHNFRMLFSRPNGINGQA